MRRIGIVVAFEDEQGNRSVEAMVMRDDGKGDPTKVVESAARALVQRILKSPTRPQEGGR